MSTKPPLPRHFTRADWKARPPRGHVKLSRPLVEGIALHHPGIDKPLGNVERVMSALRAWQDQHMAPGGLGDPAGASDIAYQVAVDQDGNTYRLRGLRFRSAANGDHDVNEQFGALLLVIANNEEPSGAMIRAVQDRVNAFRGVFPNARDIVPHSAIRPDPTDCPGDAVRDLIAAGAFEIKRGPR